MEMKGDMETVQSQEMVRAQLRLGRHQKRPGSLSFSYVQNHGESSIVVYERPYSCGMMPNRHDMQMANGG